MKAQVDIVTISAPKAEEYLENMLNGQRPVRESWVKQLADDMNAGRFQLSPDAIVLIKGQLANGQHRMWAVVECGKPQPFLLMRTDDDSLYKVIDAGIKRTIGDTMNIPNGSKCAATARLTQSHELKCLTVLGSFKVNNKLVTRSQTIEYLTKNLTAITDAVQTVSRLSAKHQTVCSHTVTAAFLYLARHAHGETADAFVQHLYSGDEHNGAAWDLREKLLRDRSSRAKLPTPSLLAFVIKSFNSSLRGTKPGELRIRDGEAFPEIAKPV